MASSAYLSRFYFSRLFRSTTGTSPGRFLTAIRLYKAKVFLRETDMSVTDIAYGVGYNSLGTFISRFTRSVGVSPARYRALADRGMPRLSATGNDGPEPGGTIRGRLLLPPLETPVRVYVGVFPTPIVQGLPLACDILDAGGFYELPDVPAGSWYLRAAAVGLPLDEDPLGQRPIAVAAHDEVQVRTGGQSLVDIEMHLTGVFDLPILIALPELDSLVPGQSRRRGRRARARIAV